MISLLCINTMYIQSVGVSSEKYTLYIRKLEGGGKGKAVSQSVPPALKKPSFYPIVARLRHSYFNNLLILLVLDSAC